MAALIVAIAVMAVVMSAAMPVWKQMAQREKEEELVFRGESIARAIGLFARRSGNAYPPTIDVLVQQKFLRKKYKDPIANDDFVPIAQTAVQQPAAGPGGQPAAQQGGRGQQQGAATPGGTPAAGAVGGIIGVTSKSTATSIRLYKGRSHYNEWAFIYTPPAATPGAGGAPGAAVPGGRGQRGGQNQPPAPGGGFPGRGNGRGNGRGPFPPGPFPPGPNAPSRGNTPTTFGTGQGRGR
ncbi:MAG TPA: type II secretion system protein [Vicinamibacterales bacterium]|nr:type II secretion system protein [Vicinamibacterales bacterium]